MTLEEVILYLVLLTWVVCHMIALKQSVNNRKEAVEKPAIERRIELPLTAFEDDKLLSRYSVRLNIDWQKEIDGRSNLKFFKGFPAKLFISESRLIITSEFYSQDRASRFVGRIPVGWMRYNTVYIELAINKIKKYSFGIFGNYITFEPHGNVGETKITFYNLSREERKLIKWDLDTARIFKKPALESGIVILDRPIEDVVKQRFLTLRHEAIISKYQKESETKRIPIDRVLVKKNANASPIAKEGKLGGTKILKEGVEEINKHLENALLTTPQEYVWMALQAQVTKCRFCGQDILKGSKRCNRCGAINF